MTITLTTLPERVRMTDRVIVEHNGLHVGNLSRDDAGKVIAYHDHSDALGGDGTISGALSWLRDMVGKQWGVTIPEPITITDPGLYDLPAAIYHSDPVPAGSLSQSRAKTLLAEGGPAKFRHRELHGQPRKAAFDFGTAAHALVLGKGAERLTVVPYESFASKAAQAIRDKAYAEGKTPIKASDLRKAEDMAEVLDQHKQAVDALTGLPEVSIFWRDGDDLWLRGQMDVYAKGSHIADYKTAADASGAGFIKAAWNFRYHMQAAWYRRLVLMVTREKLPYRIVAQESTAPYLVSVWEVPDDYLQLGYADMADAIDLYKHCRQTGEWPGYDANVQTLSPPAWAIDDDIQIGA